MKYATAVLAACLVAVGLAAQAPGDSQQRPQFRTAVNLVRIDVYPTLNGRGVDDLKPDDFEVLEDGVPQQVATFEHVAVRPAGQAATRVEPRSLRDSNQMAADPRNRLFVLFLDTYHVADEVSTGDGFGWARARGRGREKPLGPGPIDKGLVTFFDQLVGPDDLFAVMRPEMDARDLTFARRTGSLEELLSTVWGRRATASVTEDLDPDEERWIACFPPDDPLGRYNGIADEMLARRREERTIRALHVLIDRLWELREERKAVLLVSEGWWLFGPNPQLARPLDGIPVPGPPGIYVGPGGKLTSGSDPKRMGGIADLQLCNADRVNLAFIDNDREFRALPDHANRANVTFYTIDPHGLSVGRGHLETLQTLAGATDGLTIMTNDFTAGLKRIADDLSDYYLIGYYSTNTVFDGTYRKIAVKVKRPGVAVRARPGYRAPTEAEARLRTAAEDPPGPGTSPDTVLWESALVGLERLRVDRVVHVQGAWGWHDRFAATREALPSVVVELDARAVRRTEPLEEVRIRASVFTAAGRSVASSTAHVSAASRSIVIRFADTALAPGEYVARVVAQVSGQTITEQVQVNVPAGPGPFGQAILFRRGPFTGPTYQPTADPRFRRAERLRADVPVAALPEVVTARVLDRNGHPLAVPVAVGFREDGGLRFATAELALAPLAPGDYLLEFATGPEATQQKAFTAFRIVP